MSTITPDEVRRIFAALHGCDAVRKAGGTPVDSGGRGDDLFETGRVHGPHRRPTQPPTIYSSWLRPWSR